MSKIPWCEKSWNPVTGCLHNCEYCYAKPMSKRLKAMGNNKYRNEFEPTFHPDCLDEPYKRKKPTLYFVCSMADLFGGWVKDDWIKSVLEICRCNERHRFLFLTKNPSRYMEFSFPNNCLKGATISNQLDCNSLSNQECWYDIDFLSIEPIHEEIDLYVINYIENLKWVIVGKENGHKKNKIDPQMLWFTKLASQCFEYKIPFFMKHEVQGMELIQEYPRFKNEIPE